MNVADVLPAQLTERAQQQSEIEIRWQLPDEALVRVDETLLGHLTANLLDNAIKYGDRQRVDVTAERSASGTSSSRMQLRPASHARHRGTPLEPFFREPANVMTTPRFGIGLSFARAVARAHGGNVEFLRGTTDVTLFELASPLVEWHERGAVSSEPS